MSEITPADMPRIRDEMARWLEDNEHVGAFAEEILTAVRYDIPDPQRGVVVDHIGGPYHAEDLRRWVRVADLYLVNDAMTAICHQAGQSLPDGWTLHHNDPPSNVGLMIYGRPYIMSCLLADGTTTPLPIRGVLWAPTMARRGPALIVIALAERAEVLKLADIAGAIANVDPRYLAHWPRFMFGDPFPFTFGVYPGGFGLAPVLYSTWAIMRQHIAVVAQASLPRHVRRAETRVGRPEPVVHTITLRRSYAAPDGHVATATGRVYHHQWVVSGHWHRYRVGYARGRTELRWVADYVKGPDGAPMIGGERVSVLRR